MLGENVQCPQIFHEPVRQRTIELKPVTIGPHAAVSEQISSVLVRKQVLAGGERRRIAGRQRRMQEIVERIDRLLIPTQPIGAEGVAIGERLFGYFTWHADDTPPINPIGDLFKTQVWQLARFLGVPDVIVSKPASADLIEGQTDEGDFGIGYAEADRILNWLISGYSPAALLSRGFDANKVEIVRKRLAGTHWKRKLPTVALVSQTGIGESYLRPVDY